MIYPIYMYGNTILKKKALKVQKGDIDIKKLSEDMFETMELADGIGLAAPQIGKSIRVFVVDGTSLKDPKMSDFKKVFVNPKLLNEDGDLWEFEEGCLSIPLIKGRVKRKSELEIEYFDENWNHHKEVFDGMKARIIQHEYDHIEGILFTDYLNSFNKKLIKNKLLRISKGQVDIDYKIFPSKNMK